MKRIIAIVLACILLLTACTPTTNNNVVNMPQTTEIEHKDNQTDEKKAQPTTDLVSEDSGNLDISIKGLNDENLLQYVEDNIYTELVGALDSEEYFVENVEAVYYPKEYIEALASNSQPNLYFGYTAGELNAQFQGTKYVFTLSEDGQTCVVPMETLTDDVYIKALEDVIVGTGVILICVTVSLVSAPAAPAVSMIFAASATTGTSFALESGGMSFVAAAVAKGYETESFEQAMKAGTEAAGEGFKWGAITGVVVGGVGEAFALKGATTNGLSMNDAAKIQKETKWPLDVVKSIHSYDEYLIYKNAGNYPTRLKSGKLAFGKEIDWNLVDSKGRTNIERVTKWKKAPIDADGNSYELHHVGQKADSPLAILTKDEHHSKKNYSILHYAEEGKNVADDVWKKQREDFWKEILENAIAKGDAMR